MGDAPRDAKNRLLELDDPVAIDLSDDGASEFGASPVPTVVPAFDPSEYAAQFETRERMPTLTNEVELEQARLKSLPSKPPPRGGLAAQEPIEALRARLSPLTRTPELARPMALLGPVVEDPKTAYVLGFVDGVLPLETIVDVTGLPELDTLTVLDRMVSQSVLVFRRGR